MSDRYRRKVPQNELKFPLSRSDNNYEGTIKFAPFRSDEKDVFEVLTNVVSQVVTADAVVAVLVNDFNIDADRLTAVGHGETSLLNTANTKQAHEENRRIEANVSVTKKVKVTK